MTEDLLRAPAVHLFALVAALLVIKMMLVGGYTSVLRIRRRMRTLLYGAGAEGGCFCARLALGGHVFAFVARGETLAALRRQGLVVRMPTGEALRVVPARAVGAPAEAAPAELVLVTVKSYD